MNTISEELKVQISESLAGMWITPPSFYLPTMMKIVNCPSCPIFWKFIDNFFCYIVISMDVDWVLYTPVQLLLVFVFLESRT